MPTLTRPSSPVSQAARSIRFEPWRYFLGLSRDMTIIGELKRAKVRKLTVDNNKSGSASFAHTMDHQMAKEIVPWRTCVIAQRGYQADAEWYWSGPVSNVSRDYAAGVVSVDAVGWFELLMHRLLLERVNYADDDAGTIVAALLAIANARRDTHISMGISEPSQPRTRSYDVDANIGQEVQALGEIESGYDWYIDPRTREFNIVARRGQDRPACKWIFVADEDKAGGDPSKRAYKGNLRNVVENEDGSALVNDHYSRGKFSSGHAESLESQDFYDVLFQEAASLSDVPDSGILNAFSNAEIVYKQNPRTTYTILPKPHTDASVPLLFVDYDIGDTTYLTARRGKFSIDDQAVRVFGVSMDIDDLGVENVTDLKTAPS